MEGQISIYDFPEYLPDEISRSTSISFSTFCEHCSHRGWLKYDEEQEKAIYMCGYPNSRNAKCWDDWIPCTECNCCLLRKEQKNE